MNPASLPPSNGDYLIDLELGKILPNPLQPRRRFPRERIARLAQSISTQGVIQPIVVRPHPGLKDHFEVIAGERRLRAARLLKWPALPALVRRISQGQLLETALVENLQREELTPIEEAQAFRDLMDTHGYTQETLALKLGKDRSTIANMVRLLGLPAEVQKELDEGRLTVGHARALLAVPQTELQIELHRAVIVGKYSVRETERLVSKARKMVDRAKKTPSSSPEGLQSARWEGVREDLERRLGTRVFLRYNSQGVGKIEIEFYSADDFNRIFELIGS